VATVRGNQRESGSARASDADRERVVDLLKAAFVEGQLTRDELEERVGGALIARTHADLAMVTADIPAGIASAAPPAPATARATRKPRPRAKAAACMVAALVVMVIDAASTHGEGAAANLFYVVSIMVFVAAFIAWLCTLVVEPGDAPAAGQHPQRPIPAGHDDAIKKAGTGAPVGWCPPVNKGGRDMTQAVRVRAPATRTVITPGAA
jgi:hypothetical protein